MSAVCPAGVWVVPGSGIKAAGKGLRKRRRDAADRGCWPWPHAGPPNWPLLAGKPSGEPGRAPKGPLMEQLSRPRASLCRFPDRQSPTQISNATHLGSAEGWRSRFPDGSLDPGEPLRPAMSPLRRASKGGTQPHAASPPSGRPQRLRAFLGVLLGPPAQGNAETCHGESRERVPCRMGSPGMKDQLLVGREKPRT